MARPDDIAIKVSNVSKTFRLPHEKQSSIKGLFVNMFKGKRAYEKQEVLNDVSFEIKKGEFFGIVGRNGSGKSTLLKLLAGIYTPDKGQIQINGKLTPFIELGVGFNPELTGRENVFLNGALLGFNRKEMEAMYDEIVEFAELDKFMDQKLKNYSSGMQVRLAFSIAIKSDSDIYLFDEVLAVGDYAFQQKCLEHFKYLKSINKTVILVSHDANSLQMFCTEGILLNQGRIVKHAKIQDVLIEYSRINAKNIEESDIKSSQKPHGSIEAGVKVKLNRVMTVDKAGKRKRAFAPKEDIRIEYYITPMVSINNPVYGLVIQDNSGEALFATNTLDGGIETKPLIKGQDVRVCFEIKNIFNDSTLYISGAVSNEDRTEVLVRFQKIGQFRSVGWNNTARGMVYIPYKFTQP